MADEKTNEQEQESQTEARDVAADVAEMFSDKPSPEEGGGADSSPKPTEEPVTRKDRIEERKDRKKAVKERGVKEKAEGEVLMPITEKPETAPDATPKKFKIGDKEYTAQEIAGSPELIERLATTAGKYPSLQQKYVEMLEQTKKAPAQAQPEQRADEQPAITPESIQQKYAPLIKTWADQGLIDGEFAEVFPKTAPAIAMIVDEVLRMAPIVRKLAEQGLTQSREGMKARFQENLHGTLDTLATEDNFQYGALKNPEMRQKFFGYISDINPVLDQSGTLPKQLLADLWAAFCGTATRERMRKLQEELDNAKKRRWLVNETGSTRIPAASGNNGNVKDVAADVAAMFDLN